MSKNKLNKQGLLLLIAEAKLPAILPDSKLYYEKLEAALRRNKEKYYAEHSYTVYKSS